jgi:hypothetical protein
MKIHHGSWMVVLALAALAGAGCREKHEHITLETTPTAVREGFQREFPGLTISHVDSVAMPGGVMQYQVKFRDAEHRYHRKMFSAEGKLLDTREGVAVPGSAPVMK